MSTNRTRRFSLEHDDVECEDFYLESAKNFKFSRLDVINDLGTIGYGINGASGYFGFATTLTASLGHTLPFGGIVMGMIDLLNYTQQHREGKYAYGPEGTVNFVVRALSSLFLMGAGIKEATHWHAFALGVPGCGLLFAAYTIKAAVDFLAALKPLVKCIINISNAPCPIVTLDEERNKALANLFPKLITLIGWSLLAAGHPLGWVFLAATAVSRVHAAYKHGLFSQKETESSYYSARRDNTETNYADTDNGYHQARLFL